jgi:nucleotide-binding universal stress UspA family protein
MRTQPRFDGPAITSDTRHRIIVGVQDTTQPPGPLLWAGLEADRRHASLHVVCGVPAEEGPSPMSPATYVGAGAQDAMRKHLATMAHKACVELDVDVDVDDPLVRHGAPARVVTDAVDEGTLIVVVGRRAHAGVARALLGSTSREVAERSAVPVVIVPDRWVPAQASAPVVAGVAAEGQDERVLRFAFERAAALGVPLVAVHSWRIPPLLSWSPSEVQSARARVSSGLDRQLEPWRTEFPGVDVITATPAELPVDAVLEAAHGAQLVVVGRRPTGRHHVGPRLGSTLRGVLHRAALPVAVVPDAS